MRGQLIVSPLRRRARPDFRWTASILSLSSILTTSGLEMLIAVRGLMRGLLSDLLRLARGTYNLEMFLTSSIYQTRLPRRGISPRRIRLPAGIVLLLNDPATFSTNVREFYIEREYAQHGDYIPRVGWRVIDVGADVGLYSLWTSKLVKESGCVASFEPNPVSYYWLKRNVEANGFQNITTYPVALGYDEGYLDFHAITRGTTGGSSFYEGHVATELGTSVSEYQTMKVAVRKLDSSLPHMPKNFQDGVNLMKIDVEGYEIHVLRGAAKSLTEGLIERLLIEVHLRHVQETELEVLLREYGFKVDKFVRASAWPKGIIYARLAR